MNQSDSCTTTRYTRDTEGLLWEMPRHRDNTRQPLIPSALAPSSLSFKETQDLRLVGDKNAV